MIKIDQTIVGINKGTCMQAVIASLYELTIEEVPTFLDDSKGNWAVQLCKFMMLQHPKKILPLWRDKGSLLNNKILDTKDLIDYTHNDGGVNGYFFASVKSPTFSTPEKPIYHAVIVNKCLEIVHDPNPNKKALKLKPEDIRDILLVNTVDDVVEV